MNINTDVIAAPLIGPNDSPALRHTLDDLGSQINGQHAKQQARGCLTDSLNPTIAQAFAPLMFARAERRVCPSEVRKVIPSIALSEWEEMRATLNKAEQRAMKRVFTGASITDFGGLYDDAWLDRRDEIMAEEEAMDRREQRDEAIERGE